MRTHTEQVGKALAAKKSILFEGAQGTFLDLDHGTYPYVTSSNTTAGGACTGSGVPPHCIDEVVGVMKEHYAQIERFFTAAVDLNGSTIV